MTNVIYILFINIHRDDLNGEVEVNERNFYDMVNLSAWHSFYLNDMLKDQGQESGNLRLGYKNKRRNAETNAAFKTGEGVGEKIAFTHLYILKYINIHYKVNIAKICPGHNLA